MKNRSLGELAQERRQQQLAQRQSQQPSQGPKENPEINAKIDAFAAANPKLTEYYTNLPKERLVRVALMFRMQEADRKQSYQERQVERLREWVTERPTVAAKIDKMLANVSEEKKIGAFVNIARREQQRIGAQAPAPLGQSV